MDFREYAQGVKFEHVQPQDPGFYLEILNSKIPGNEGIPADYPLRMLCEVPRMSTYAIACVINKAVKEMPESECFVNVGVWHGFSFLAGMVGNSNKHCVGIDNFSEFGGPRTEFRERFLQMRSEKHDFFEMDYRKYFNELHQEVDRIGVYLYDGSHDYANQRDGLQIAEPFLADGAIVIVDDTNWKDPDTATRDFMAASQFNWEIILDEKTAANAHPTWWNGILVIKKGELKGVVTTP